MEQVPVKRGEGSEQAILIGLMKPVVQGSVRKGGWAGEQAATLLFAAC